MFQVLSFKTPSIHFGNGTISILRDELKRLDSHRVLIITGPTVKKAGILEKALAACEGSSLEIEVNIQGRDTPEPGTHIAEETARVSKVGNFEAIVGVGGGSILDVAKMTAALTRNPGRVRDYFGKEKVPRKGLPTIMIPTTSGTGAEVTKHAIFLDSESKVKKAVASTALLPDVAIVDPELTCSCPREVTASAGIDAFIHAAESFVSKNSNTITDVLSLEAIRIIRGWLGPAVADGGNIEARYWMALGSLISGLVLNNSGTSLVHAMAYPIGGEFHIPHGISLSAILISCFESIISASEPKFARLACAMGEAVPGTSKRDSSQHALDAIRYLLKSVDLPLCLPDIGIMDQSNVCRWAVEAHAERRLLSRCARDLTVQDIEKIYRRAFVKR